MNSLKYCIATSCFALLFLAYGKADSQTQEDPNAPAVDALYHQILERAPDPSGGPWMISRLGHDGQTIKEAVRFLAHSPEYQLWFVQGKSPQEIVSKLYVHILARQPKPEELSNSTNPDVYIDSPEYALRFGDNTVPGHSDVRGYGPASDYHLDSRTAFVKHSFDIRKSPPAPGDSRYVIIFEAEPPEITRLRPGHASVLWETQAPDGSSLELKGWGIYGEGEDGSSSTRLARAFTTRNAEGKPDLPNQADEDALVLAGNKVFSVEVEKGEYDSTWNEAQSYAGKHSYNAFTENCVHFDDAIARQLGLAVPTVLSQLPAEYLMDLMNINLALVSLDQSDGTYRGTLFNGKPQGQATKSYKNGDVYAGSYENGVPSGFGSLDTSAGWHIDGPFVNGKPEGLCRMTGHGYAFRGPFKQGVMDGDIVAEYPPMQGMPNARVESKYKDGVIQSPQDIYFVDGRHWANIFDKNGNWLDTLEVDKSNHARIIALPASVIDAAKRAMTAQMGGSGVTAPTSSSAPGTTSFIMIPGVQR